MVFKAGKLDRWASKFASQVLRPGVAQAVAPRSKKPPKHDLTLYDFEASPWCRLVREYATILDLSLTIKPCPRETVLFGEGSFGPRSTHRMEAMEWHQKKIQTIPPHRHDNLTFPLLVDKTNVSTKNTEYNGKDNDATNIDDGAIIVGESYEILTHLWTHFGDSVLPGNPRSDQTANASQKSFASRFFSLAGPSYLRPWPRCGLMLFDSYPQNEKLILYQAENCPESRLIREALCSLQISYRSVPVAEGSCNAVPPTPTATNNTIPVLSVQTNDQYWQHMVGAEDCLEYLNETYWKHSSPQPSLFDPLPPNNLGRSGGPNFSVFTAATSAIQKGQRAFVPNRAME